MRQISATPTTVGSWTVSCSANDGRGGTTSTTFAFSVSAPVSNQPPQVANALADQLLTPGAGFSFTFPANSFLDPEGQALTYTHAVIAGPNAASWLTFNAATRTFSGTASNLSGATWTVRVTAKDSANQTVYDDFTITIDEAGGGQFSMPIGGGEQAGESYGFEMGIGEGATTPMSSPSTGLPVQEEERWFTCHAVSLRDRCKTMLKINSKCLSTAGEAIYFGDNAFTGIAFAIGDSGIASPAQYFDGRQVELTSSFGGVPYGDVRIVDRGCVYQGDYNSGPGVFDDALYSGVAIEFDEEGCRCIREELFSNGESVLEVEYDEACNIRSWSGFIDSRFAMSFELDAKNKIRRFSLIDPDSVEDRVYIDRDSDGGVYNIFLGRVYKEQPALVSRSMSLSGLRMDWIGRFPLSSRLLLGGKSMDDDFIDQVMANPTFSNVKEISFSNASVSERVMERLSGRVNIGV